MSSLCCDTSSVVLFQVGSPVTVRDECACLDIVRGSFLVVIFLVICVFVCGPDGNIRILKHVVQVGTCVAE